MDKFVRTYAFDAPLQRAENVLNHPGIDKILLRSNLTRGGFKILPDEIRISATSVEIKVGKFSNKKILLSKVTEAIEYFNMPDIIVRRLSEAILTSANFPSHRSVLKIESQQNLKDFERWLHDAPNLRFPVLINCNLLTSRSIVGSLVTYSVPVFADQVQEVEHALELKSWGVTEIVTSHITVLNAI